MKVPSQGVMKLLRLQASAPPARLPLVITIPHNGRGVKRLKTDIDETKTLRV